MRPLISVTRMSSADAVALNETIQTSVTDCIGVSGEDAVGAPVIEAAAQLGAATSPLTQIESASYEERRNVDTAADRCIGAVYNRCVDVVAGYESSVVPLTEDQKAELASARWLLGNLFPEGKGFLSSRWAEQFGVTEMIIQDAGTEEAVSHIARLGLTHTVDLMVKVHEIYGEKMGFTAALPDDTESSLFLWHQALEAYLAAVIYAQRGNPDLKAKLTAPYETMARAVRDAHKRRSRPQTTPAPAAEAAPEAAPTQ